MRVYRLTSEKREEILRAEFDLQTGLMGSMYGMRFRDPEKTKTAWRGEFSDWRALHGIKVLHRNVAIWEDQGEPYGLFEIEGTDDNVYLSETISLHSFEVDETSFRAGR